MNKSWVLTWRIIPPTGCVVSTRNGSNVFWAAYSRFLRQWYMIYPGGEEKIDEPQMLFVSHEYADTHKREGAVRRPTIKLREGKRKAVQYELAL